MADTTIAGYKTVFETRHLSIHVQEHTDPATTPKDVALRVHHVVYRAYGVPVLREDFLTLLQAQETAK